MGLKTKEEYKTKQGVVIDYWNLQSVNDVIEKKTIILMNGYINEQSDKKFPVCRENDILPMDGIYKTAKEVYDYVKAYSFIIDEVEDNIFFDATDVI